MTPGTTSLASFTSAILNSQLPIASVASLESRVDKQYNRNAATTHSLVPYYVGLTSVARHWVQFCCDQDENVMVTCRMRCWAANWKTIVRMLLSIFPTADPVVSAVETALSNASLRAAPCRWLRASCRF